MEGGDPGSQEHRKGTELGDGWIRRDGDGRWSRGSIESDTNLLAADGSRSLVRGKSKNRGRLGEEEEKQRND